ncbi:MAG: histidinol-phosphate transaminase [Candidatus Electryonea clarkiae]|nr:histidinol-phosphate transaminase [Candidatus Electryonea clarkiae]MDP8287137.1 histidinol-phosphate transaminase [Candidatus Electryonea clarkiae]
MFEIVNGESEKFAKIIKLSQNENALGASPLALEAVKENILSIFRYPDVLHTELKHKLAEKYSVSFDNIVISAGSVALMDMSVKAFVGFDENIVTAEVTFPGYKIIAGTNRRSIKFSKMVDYKISLDNLLSTCDEKTKVVFIANPNNPTSTMVTHDEMKKFLQSVPSDMYVVCDEAYAEYITDTDYPDSFELLKEFPNLIIFRTFSKIYGLAGLRIGYAIAHPDVIQSLMKHRTPFSISDLASVAALAALDDTEYLEKCVAVNSRERAILYNGLIDMGINAVFPHGNFVFMEFSKQGESEKMFDELIKKGIIARPLGPFGNEKGLRISVGRPEENQRLLKSLKQIFA